MLRNPARAAILLAAMLAFSPLAASAATAAPTAASTTIPTVVQDDGPVTWSVEASPTKEGGRRAFTYDVDPGTQIQDSFLITNAGDAAAEFIIYATDAFNDPDTGNFSLLAHDVAPTDLGAWITPADAKLTIGPGLQATVPFNLLIPSDAGPGDHSAGIVAAVLTEAEQDGSTVLLEQRVGVRMYLTVSGEAVSSVEVQGMTSSYAPSLNPFGTGDLTVGYDVRNTGNKRVDVTQALQAAGIFGIPVGGSEPAPIRDLLPRQTVHVNVELTGVGALLYATSTVEVTPMAVGTAPATAGATPDATPAPSATPTPETGTPTPGATPGADAADAYEQVSEQSTTIAITWTLLALIVVVAAAVYLIYRYITGTRERMYAAIDEAAEAARAEAAEAARAEAEEKERAEAERVAAAEAAAALAAKRAAAARKAPAKKAPAKKSSSTRASGTKASTAKAGAAAEGATASRTGSAAVRDAEKAAANKPARKPAATPADGDAS